MVQQTVQKQETLEFSVDFLDEGEIKKTTTEDWTLTMFLVYQEEGELLGVAGLIKVQKVHCHRNYSKIIMDAAAEMSVLLDRDGVILESSHSFAEQLGLQVDRIQQKNLWELASSLNGENETDFQKSLHKIKAAVVEVFQGGKEKTKFKLENSKHDWFEYRVSSAVLQHGQVQAALVQSWDITERTNAKHALEEKNEFYKRFVKYLPNAFALCEMVTDENGVPCDHRYIEVNEHFTEMTGLAADECIGKCWTELFPGIEDDSADWIGRTSRVVLEGGVDRFERYSNVQDKWWKGVTYSPSNNKSVTLFIEITEQKDIERSLRESEEKHRTLFETMKQGVSYLNAE